MSHEFIERDGDMMFNDKVLSIDVALHPTDALRSKQLVGAARAGSTAAFTELMEIYAQRVFRKLLIITRNREDAEDALQDTFLRAYRGLHSFEERSSFYTWITTIAINSALMILRKRRNRSEISFDRLNEAEDDSPAFEVTDTRPTPEHICLHRQRYACAVRSISKLQPRLRQVIEMQMKEKCSVREIAQALQISEAAVKSRLRRARMRLDPARTVKSSQWDARGQHSLTA
jgi:RNA polymerase sigma-70 factor (ECF subfamily)